MIHVYSDSSIYHLIHGVSGTGEQKQGRLCRGYIILTVLRKTDLGHRLVTALLVLPCLLGLRIKSSQVRALDRSSLTVIQVTQNL